MSQGAVRGQMSADHKIWWVGIFFYEEAAEIEQLIWSTEYRYEQFPPKGFGIICYTARREKHKLTAILATS